MAPRRNLVILVILALTGCTVSPASTSIPIPPISPSNPLATYTEPKTGVKVSYPADWAMDPQGGLTIIGKDSWLFLDSLGVQAAFSLEQLCTAVIGDTQNGEPAYEMIRVGGDPACISSPITNGEIPGSNVVISHPLENGRLEYVWLNADVNHARTIADTIRWPAPGEHPLPSCTPDPLPKPQSFSLDSGLVVEIYPIDDCGGAGNAILEGFRHVPAAALEKRAALRPALDAWDKNGDRKIKVDDAWITAHTMENGYIQVERSGQPVYRAQMTPHPVGVILNLGSYENHWVLETVGSVVEDGTPLNPKFGYEESFNWQLIDGKPFYFFLKGGKVGISFAGKDQAIQFDSVTHYVCCSAGIDRPLGNNSMITFFANWQGMWVYVEAGVYS